MRMTQVICAAAALLVTTTLTTTTALADGRDWNDGPVLNVASIRTVDGHFDDYMHWLATSFKKQSEAAKKAGLIIDYSVIVVGSARTERSGHPAGHRPTRTGQRSITSAASSMRSSPRRRVR